MQKARNVVSDKYDYRTWSYLVSAIGDITFHIPEIIKDKALAEVKDRVEEPLDEMVDKFKMIDANLQEYHETIKLDSTFYL